MADPQGWDWPGKLMLEAWQLGASAAADGADQWRIHAFEKGAMDIAKRPDVPPEVTPSIAIFVDLLLCRRDWDSVSGFNQDLGDWLDDEARAENRNRDVPPPSARFRAAVGLFIATLGGHLMAFGLSIASPADDEEVPRG